MKNQVLVITGIVLFLAIIGSVLYFGVSKQGIIGLSDIKSLGIQNGNLLISTSVGNEKDNLIVQLDRDELNSKLEGEGWQVDKGVRIGLDLISSQEVYLLQNNVNEHINQINYIDTGNFLSASLSKSTFVNE